MQVPTVLGNVTRDSASDKEPGTFMLSTALHFRSKACNPQSGACLGRSYLHQRVPVCNGLPRIRQHLTPVLSAQPLSFIAYLTHADDLIMTYTVKMGHNSFFLKFWYAEVKATTQMSGRNSKVVGYF